MLPPYLMQILEADHNKEGACEAYEQAAAMFERDNKKSNAGTCLLKVAQFSAEGGGYAKAAQIFEASGRDSLQSRLGAFSARGHFFMALLCFLALGDTVQVANKVADYRSADHSFASSRECAFVEKLVGSIEAMDSEAFAEACADFDRISPLDPLKTSLLLKAKHLIPDNNDVDNT
ncbi:MAG: hypothetical protein EOP84_26230 [Verrucomicrobiaceae bacterium]|nr:MAG: hypothetical protein EOP84_26230 [Verrucomicrobiaceae bacterium]